ncbi:MAG: hypothetical protein Q7S70_02365 [bacterium]|nr:hypothetical protein [bacterium]
MKKIGIRILSAIAKNPVGNLVLFAIFMTVIAVQLLLLLVPNLFFEMIGRKGFFVFPKGIPEKLILIDRSSFAKYNHDTHEYVI